MLFLLPSFSALCFASLPFCEWFRSVFPPSGWVEWAAVDCCPLANIAWLQQLERLSKPACVTLVTGDAIWQDLPVFLSPLPFLPFVAFQKGQLSDIGKHTLVVWASCLQTYLPWFARRSRESQRPCTSTYAITWTQLNVNGSIKQNPVTKSSVGEEKSWPDSCYPNSCQDDIIGHGSC